MFKWFKKQPDQANKPSKNILSRARVLWQERCARTTAHHDILSRIEHALLAQDFGLETTDWLIESLKKKVPKDALDQAYIETLRTLCIELLSNNASWPPEPLPGKPFVTLVVGANGSGKTTSIAKLAHALGKEYTVCLAAGDTFRAAAIEQLKVWGERLNVPTIAHQHGADSAAVIFDALEAATARNIDIVLADTAGRLHQKTQLMDELGKIQRVLQKKDPLMPHATLMVVDASLGQLAQEQISTFHACTPLTGLIITKLDGTAKGGAICQVAKTLKLPILFSCAGEGLEDISPFNAHDYVHALIPDLPEQETS